MDEDMPDLPDYVAPLEETDISIELQFPSLGDVSMYVCACMYRLGLACLNQFHCSALAG